MWLQLSLHEIYTSRLELEKRKEKDQPRRAPDLGDRLLASLMKDNSSGTDVDIRYKSLVKDLSLPFFRGAQSDAHVLIRNSYLT